MNNLNYLGASLLIFELDSHLNPSLYKKNFFSKYENKRKTEDPRKNTVKVNGKPVSILGNTQLPPLK